MSSQPTQGEVLVTKSVSGPEPKEEGGWRYFQKDDFQCRIRDDKCEWRKPARESHWRRDPETADESDLKRNGWEEISQVQAEGL